MREFYCKQVTTEDREKIEELIMKYQCTPIDVIGYYIFILRQVESANEKLVNVLGHERAIRIINESGE
jgi:RNA-binding protein YhbY